MDFDFRTDPWAENPHPLKSAKGAAPQIQPLDEDTCTKFKPTSIALPLFPLEGRAQDWLFLSDLQPSQFEGARLHLRKIILQLLQQPAFRAAAKHLFQPHGHFR